VRASQASQIYPDLLSDEADAATASLVRDLGDLYRGASAPAALRHSLHVALAESTHSPVNLDRANGRRSRFGIRASALMVAAAAVLVIGVVGYAVAPAIQHLLATERGVPTLPMQEIAQSETANGVTVKVDRAYADVNRIIVAYTIQVPAGFNNSTSGIDGKITLNDAQGASFPVIQGQGITGDAPHTSAGLVSFDAESLPPGTAHLDLRLNFPDVRAKSQQQGASDLTAGAFAFTFALPVGSGQIVTASKTEVANQVPVTLDRIVVTQSETRVYMRFPAGAGIGASDWYADVHVFGAGWDSRQLPAGFSGEMTLGSMFTNSSGEHVTTFSGDYRSRHGEWSVTVDALSAVDTKAPSTESGLPKQARVAGPWTYKVSLP
jgi:hypothetical protein